MLAHLNTIHATPHIIWGFYVVGLSLRRSKSRSHGRSNRFAVTFAIEARCLRLTLDSMGKALQASHIQTCQSLDVAITACITVMEACITIFVGLHKSPAAASLQCDYAATPDISVGTQVHQYKPPVHVNHFT